MRHSQNAKGRIFYTASLFILYEWMIKNMKLSVNTSAYGLFLILILSYYIFGVYSLKEKYSVRDTLISSILNGLIFFILLIFHKKPEIIIYCIIYTISQNVFRYVLGKIYRSNIRVLILGDEERERRVKKAIIDNREYSYVGFLSNKNEDALDKIQNVKEIIDSYSVNKIIYLKDLEDEIVESIFQLKLAGLKVIDSDTFLQNVEGKIDVDKISKKWFLKSKGFDVLTSTLDKRLKRFMDITLAVIVFLIGLPFMLVTYCLVKLDNPKKIFSNPVFFKQNRIGMSGNVFQIIKFRSMRLHNPDEHSKYASEKDDRITTIGKFIRKTRLDELPQILNVLNGDMSFVGPRPEWDELGRDYEKKINMYKLRYTVKPGLTGWAQVMYPYGASLDDAKKKLEYDIYYIKHQNIAMDIIILFKTVKVVLFGKGM
ncbi:MAG: exopolysaccharide biosynthesis polyprenyl glycosylphosphotransferase [Fusobacteriaceae bacterium]